MCNQNTAVAATVSAQDKRHPSSASGVDQEDIYISKNQL
jgi:hypothetical protein